MSETGEFNLFSAMRQDKLEQASEEIKKQAQLNPEDKLTFGKWKGCTINEVGEWDLDYLIFMRDKGNIEFSERTLQLIDEAKENKHTYETEWDDIFGR